MVKIKPIFDIEIQTTLKFMSSKLKAVAFLLKG
jgi:hypothetical protein